MSKYSEEFKLKVVNYYLNNHYGCIVYDRVLNELRTNNYNVNSLKYENMGEDFTISISNFVNGKYVTKVEHPYTGIKLESNGTISDRDVIVAEKVTEKTTKIEQPQETQKQENLQHKLDNEPKTGIIKVVSIVSVIVAVSFIGFVICKKKMYK